MIFFLVVLILQTSYSYLASILSKYPIDGLIEEEKEDVREEE